MDSPSLTEPGIRYYLNHSLKNCKNTKDNYYNIIFNVILLFGLISLSTLILYYKYKGNTDIREKHRKEEKKKLYILEQIKKMQEINKNNSIDLITNLPLYKKEF